MIRSSLLVLTTLCCLYLPALAQIEKAVQLSHDYEPSKDLAVGDVITLRIRATIDPGFHVYSARQVPQMAMLAATFELDEATQGIEIAAPLDDQGKRETAFDDIFGADVSLYHDQVVYLQRLRITAPNPTLAGFLRYQTCDDSRCIPGSYDVDLRIAATAAKPATPAPQERQQVETPQPATTPDRPRPTETPTLVPATQPADDQQPVLPASDGRMLDAVHWTHSVAPGTRPQAGDQIEVVFRARIDPGFHVYSSVPPAKPAGLPTTFNLDGGSRDIELAGDLRETGQPKPTYDEVFETEVLLFEDSVVFTQVLRATGPNPVIDGYLSYQVCDDSRCVLGKVEVSESWGAAPVAEPADPEPPADGDSSLGLLMLQGFLFGLASIFTPCIFPMIPLTVSFFTKQSKNRARGLRDAAFYGLSIIFIYTALALLITVLFGMEALQRVANHPVFNLFFFGLLFVFSLSFLGMFEIMLPDSWSTAASKGGDRGGLGGIFLMALALAIVSFSCTGPLVTTALGNAASGSIFAPVMTMLAFSVAMALPFVLFAIFPSWLKSMPRSGGWLNAVKVSLGLIELALAFIYLSRADLVLHWGIMDREIFIGAWIVIFSILGIYLLGKLQLPHDSPLDRISVPRLLLAMSSFWFVLYLVPGLWGAPLRMLGGFLPSNTRDVGVIIQQDQLAALGGMGTTNDICDYPGKISAHLNGDTPQGFCAFYDLEQGLAYARQVNKPVFLDFTGHTCANCRYLEKNAWPDPELRRLITKEYVLISLYTDDTERLPEPVLSKEGKKLRTVGDRWLQHQIDVYRSNAQPFYVLLDHAQNLLMPPMGFNPPLDVQAYREFFQAGLKAFAGQKS
ncbi:MAG: thioredoxin family protein [Bacteroidia bacterium]